MPQGEVVADFTQYEDAVKYVEKLVANGFPAGFIAIVGTDVRTVERVRGKLSYARVALNGAITGSWLGLIFAFLFGGTATASPGVSSPLTAGIVMGAGLGMLFAVIRMSLAKSKRIAPIDFRSGNITIRVEGTAEHGIATIWDADILIWAASTICEMKKRGRNDIPRKLNFMPYDLLKGIGRETGGRQYKLLRDALFRLQSTSVRTNIRAEKA